jgi:hypothetical protein
MPVRTSHKLILYILDDEASMPGAPEGPFDSAKLDTRGYSKSAVR